MGIHPEDAMAYADQLHADLTDLAVQVSRLAAVTEDIAAILAHAHDFDLAGHLTRKADPA